MDPDRQSPGGSLKAEESRALVASAASRPSTARPTSSAAFLAQLIGTRQGAPQTREKRRAEPAEAAAAYRRIAAI
jgi:hypothetical protein